MSTFQEYFDNKKKLKAKPSTEVVADYHGKSPVAPLQGRGSSPYRAPGTDAGQIVMKGEKVGGGLQDEGGDKKLKYEPDTSGGAKGKVVQTWPKNPTTKTEAFIEKTRDMNLESFTKFMKEQMVISEEIPYVTSYEIGKIHPDPIETTRYIVSLAKQNSTVMENLSFELKKQNAIKEVLESLLVLPETRKTLYEIVGKPFGFDVKKSGREIANLEDEELADKLSDDEEFGGEGDEEFGDEGDEEFGDEGDEELGDNDEDEEFGDEETPELGDEIPEDELGDELDDENPDQFGDEDLDDEDLDDEDLDDEELAGDEFDDDEDSAKPPRSSSRLDDLKKMFRQSL